MRFEPSPCNRKKPTTKYQEEGEQLKRLIAQSQAFGDDFDKVGNLDAITSLLKSQKEIIQLLLGRLQRYETAHQAFVASIQGSL